NRAAFHDLDGVALVVRLLGMRVVARAAHHVLAVHRVLHLALDQDRDGLLHLVADDAPDQGAGQPGLGGAFAGGGLDVGHLADALSFMTVRTRAMSRRVLRSWLVLVSCWVAICMRSEKCAFSRSPSSF